MRRKLIAIMIFLGLTVNFVAPSLAGGGACRKLFQGALSPNYGISVNNLVNAKTGFDYFMLGNGLMGGTVYRMVSKSDSKMAIIYKQYANSRSLKNDLVGFKVLAASISPASQFRVAKVLRIEGENDLYMENVLGETVENVLKNTTIPRAERRKIETKYNLMIDDLEKALKMNPNLMWSARHLDGLEARFQVGSREGLKNNILNMFVKPDNVIVDYQTLELIIIDPY